MTTDRQSEFSITRDTSRGPAPEPKREPTEGFRFVHDREEKILEYQFSVARWILASLLIVNGGALLALVNSFQDEPAVVDAGTPFLVGVIAALLSGTFTWLNCNCIVMATGHRRDWETLDYQESETADRWDMAGSVMTILALVSALISLAAFPIGALEVQEAVEESRSALNL